MKKYQRLEVIGNVIAVIGMLIGILSACINLDQSVGEGTRVLLIGTGIGIILFLTGYSLYNFKSVEGRFIGTSIVVGAWLYKKAHIRTEFFSYCNQIVRKAGGYENAYDSCYDRYMRK